MKQKEMFVSFPGHARLISTETQRFRPTRIRRPPDAIFIHFIAFYSCFTAFCYFSSILPKSQNVKFRQISLVASSSTPNLDPRALTKPMHKWRAFGSHILKVSKIKKASKILKNRAGLRCLRRPGLP